MPNRIERMSQILISNISFSLTQISNIQNEIYKYSTFDVRQVCKIK